MIDDVIYRAENCARLLNFCSPPARAHEHPRPPAQRDPAGKFWSANCLRPGRCFAAK